MTTAAATAPAQQTVLRIEIVETIKLAWPMALTQLGQIAMMTTDLALIGRLGPEAVAAVGLAQMILFAGFALGMGPVSAVAPLAAQAFGARNPRMVRRSLRVGLWAAVLLGIPVNLVQLWGEDILIAAGQTGEAATLAARYLTSLAWSMIPAWCFIALRNFMGSVNRPEPALWVTLAAIPLNGLLAYGLIYGAFGLPRLDLLGAGLATTCVNIAMCVVAIWICYARPPFKKYRVLGRFWRLDLALMRQLIVIALQVATVVFMIPFGISLAATVRVGHAVGRRDPVAARRSGFVAIAISALFMSATTLLVILLRNIIPLLFLGGSTADAETAKLAATLLLIGATFYIFDAIQAVAAGALRGLNDTRVPMLFAAISFWLIGFASSYLLAFRWDFGVYGIWIGFSLGVITFAALLTSRFHILTRRRYLPDVLKPEATVPSGTIKSHD
jgi:MATE family multidrug resistance protein